ncbi:DUF397 domain-containing protein [Streptomyces sp. NRRL S-350]|uniref:DUF397 domain-containing protein n=1 Tax=Streptomyces sp. NRRL S-350 TaxID=1463902 RepID=UPI0004C2A33D|nr:DUF397 domain-containing protein [Streptomyces sp. NRRL S-350]
MPESNARGWYKSSYSAQANECVETRQSVSSDMAVRDSKDPSGPTLRFTAEAWAAFIGGMKAGELADG